MGTPGWLLKIVIEFLKNRKLKVRMNGKSSSTKDMPGGCRQGTILGLFIFIIVSNLAGNPSSSSSLGELMTAPPSQRKKMDNKKCKYVDDLTIAKSIELKSKLSKADECQLNRPLVFLQRTEHYMPIENNEMQKEIYDFEAYCEKHKLKINSKKTKTMLFNSKTKHYTANIRKSAIPLLDGFMENVVLGSNTFR